MCDGIHAQSQSAVETSSSISTASSDVLAHARSTVAALFEQSANIICRENVTQTILDRYNRSIYEEHSLFDYRLQTDTSGKSLTFVESRERLQAPFHDPSHTVLLTDGFGNMLLILHPSYETSYTFEADGDESIAGVHTVRLRFKSVPDAASPVMIQVRGQNYPVALQGTVWIEPQSGNVVKLAASNDSGMDELGIRSMNTEILYIPVTLHNPEASYWMPASAVIDVETAHRHWRNVHNFSTYKRFQTSMRAESLPENR
jgi:hypothetical protein